MEKTSLIIDQIRIAPKEEAAFNAFLHHEYLPALLKNPEISCIRRYEEFGTKGSLAWFNKSFLTIYELSSAQNLDDLTKEIPEKLQMEMRKYQTEKFRFFSRNRYREIYVHERKAINGPFGSRPFFVVTVEAEGQKQKEFQTWYDEKYLPKTMADIPMWCACRRYASVGRQPAHYHTIYEAENIWDLERGFELLRAAYRFGSNTEWESWVGPAITFQNAASFQPIFRRPG
ncbi:MAG: hypothetical protein Tsb0015_00960 [Simkaniaceae bacterium]